jgi:hypothetical protein
MTEVREQHSVGRWNCDFLHIFPFEYFLSAKVLIYFVIKSNFTYSSTKKIPVETLTDRDFLLFVANNEYYGSPTTLTPSPYVFRVFDDVHKSLGKVAIADVALALCIGEELLATDDILAGVLAFPCEMVRRGYTVGNITIDVSFSHLPINFLYR